MRPFEWPLCFTKTGVSWIGQVWVDVWISSQVNNDFFSFCQLCCWKKENGPMIAFCTGTFLKSVIYLASWWQSSW